MPLDKSRTLRVCPIVAGKEAFRLGAIESWMHAGNIVKHLPHLDPTRQHRNIGDERDIAHKLIALGVRVAAQNLQLTLIGQQAQNRVERCSLARAVGTNEPQDAALFDMQFDAIQRDRRSKLLAETARFYACHDFSAPSFANPAWRFSRMRHPAGLSLSGQAAEWLHKSWAIFIQKFSVRPE